MIDYIACSTPPASNRRFNNLLHPHKSPGYGKLTVIRYLGYTKKGRASVWECQCVCGKVIAVRQGNLINGSTRSCGCWSAELQATSHRKHGYFGTPEYYIWSSIKERCHNPKRKDYPRYGGRGIKMCQRWKDSVEAFIADVGLRPGQGFSLDRKNNDGDYEPGNCHWVTSRQQSRNRRNNRLLTFNGLTLCLAEWAERTGVARDTISRRLDKYGWSIEKALTTPANRPWSAARAAG